MDKAETAQYIIGKNEIEVTSCFCGTETVKALIKSHLSDRIGSEKRTARGYNNNGNTTVVNSTKEEKQ